MGAFLTRRMKIAINQTQTARRISSSRVRRLMQYLMGQTARLNPRRTWRGVSVVLLPRSQAVIGAVVILLLPPIIELIQYALPALGRSCQSDDLVHNWTGALVGLLVAATARGLAKARPGR